VVPLRAPTLRDFHVAFKIKSISALLVYKKSRTHSYSQKETGYTIPVVLLYTVQKVGHRNSDPIGVGDGALRS